ncbi:MAG: hypothetical protein KA352_05940 [Flavobacteriales bacterium]|nr:hypothetical protein [Flavobacteriales bacterium]
MYTAVQQPDGKVLVGGSFSNYDTIACGRLVRLLEDNGIDPSFDTGTGADNEIRSIALQPDGKILVVGDFLTFNGEPRNRIARLNADGSLDPTFDPGPGATALARAVAVQADGKILVGGDFYAFAGGGPVRLGRLNADGSRDTTFNVGGFGANAGPVHAIALQPDGRIVIGGDFFSYNGVSRNQLARVMPDGTLDTSFVVGSGFASDIRCVLVQTDGRIVVGGYFLSVNGQGHPFLARLYTTGAVDSGFNTGTGPNHYVYSVAQQADGKLLIAGQFTAFEGVPRAHVARLNIDGTLDTGFTTYPGSPLNCEVVMARADGRVLVGGHFGSCGGTLWARMVRLQNDGSLDNSFHLGTGASNYLEDMALRPDGRMVLVGDFMRYNNAIHPGLVQVMPDGSVDASFDTGSGTDSRVRGCALQPDGKLLIVGTFAHYNGSPAGRIARLNTDGSLDPGFNSGTGANFDLRSVALQPDGKILVSGTPTSYNGVPVGVLFRLNADGTLDTGFPVGTGPNYIVMDFAFQPDGKIIISGWFSEVDGVARGGIARLNTDGSLDTSFDPGTGVPNTYYVGTCALQADGNVVIGGSFEYFNGVAHDHIARLLPDGSLDATFTTAVSGTVWDSQVLANGKILIAGGFWNVNGTLINSLARLLPDGTLDSTFQIGSGADGSVEAFVVQPDGNLVIGGVFTDFNGVGRNRVARITPEFSTGITNASTSKDMVVPNPSEGRFNWHTDMVGPVDIMITDLAGRTVTQMNAMVPNGGICAIDLTGRPAGTYVLTCTGPQGRRTARAVVR